MKRGNRLLGKKGINLAMIIVVIVALLILGVMFYAYLKTGKSGGGMVASIRDMFRFGVGAGGSSYG